MQQRGDKVHLHRQAHTGLQREQTSEAPLRTPATTTIEISVDQHVFPWDQHMIHNQDRIVLIETARKRIIERGSRCARHQLIRGARNQLHPFGIHRRHKHQREVRVIPHYLGRTKTDKVIVGQRRVGCHHLGPADDNARVGLFLHLNVNVFHFVDRLVAVNRWVNDSVVKVQAGFLNAFVPVARVIGELTIKLGISPQRTPEGCFVVRGAPHPTVTLARPVGDSITLLAHLFRAAGVAEEFVSVTAVAGIGVPAQAILADRIVQRVVQLTDRSRCITECRVSGDIFHSFAVDINLTAVLQTFQVFGTGERAFVVSTKVFRFHLSLPRNRHSADRGFGRLLK